MEHLEQQPWWEGSFELGPEDVAVRLTRTELSGLANAIGEALQAVEDWEFDTRVGLLPTEARALRDSISDILRRTSPPR